MEGADMKKVRKEDQKPTEADFYVVHNGLLDGEREQTVCENLRDFSVSVVKSREDTGPCGTALVFRGENDVEWFEANRPNLMVAYLSGTTIQVLTSLYGLFGRTLPPILQEGDRPEAVIAVDEPVFAPAVDEWQTEN